MKKIETRNGSNSRAWAVPMLRYEVKLRKDRIFWPFYRRTWWARLITPGPGLELVESCGPFNSRRAAQEFAWEWQRRRG